MSGRKVLADQKRQSCGRRRTDTSSDVACSCRLFPMCVAASIKLYSLRVSGTGCTQQTLRI